MTEEAATEAAVEPREAGVGETLARARMALGLSIEDCAQQLKYPPRKLEALEAERFDQLPAGTFARGMLRAYARLLNLDAEAIVARVARQTQSQDTIDTAVSFRQPIPFSEGGKRGNFVYVALTVVALGVVAWVGWEWQHERSGGAKMTFVPGGSPAPQEGKGATASKAPAKSEPTALASTVTPQIAPIRQEEPAKAEKPAAVASAAAATPPPEGKKRIVMRFEKESWVEVRGGSGKVLLSQINAPGSERVIDGDPPFQLTIGNATHVRVTYDDKPVDLVPHARTEVAKITLN